jgi:hypothetical protein
VYRVKGEGEENGTEASAKETSGENGEAPKKPRREGKPRKEKEATETPEGETLKEETNEKKPRENRKRNNKAKKEADADGENEETKENAPEKTHAKKDGNKKKPIDRSNQPVQYTPYVCKRNFKSKYQEYMGADWRRHQN